MISLSEKIKVQLIEDLRTGQGFAILSEIKRGRLMYRKNKKELEAVICDMREAAIIKSRKFGRKEFLILKRSLR